MARIAIKKTQQEVSIGTGCSIKTIGIFEVNTSNVSKKNADVIRRYYESHGVEFLPDAYYHTIRVKK